MVTYWRRFGTLALLLSVTGCGGGDAAAPAGPEAGAAAGGAAQGQAGPGMTTASDGLGGAPPQAGAPGAGAEGNPEESPPATPAKPAYDGPSLIEFVPPSLKTAVGARPAAFAEANHPLNRIFASQFKPLAPLLSRTGLKPQDIDAMWIGSNRETDDVLLCIRTVEKFSPEDVRKSLQAGAALDKLGKAEVFKLADHPVHQNAVGFFDAQTILIGRAKSVTDALKNPKSGSIRLGLDAAQAAQAYVWLSQDPAALRQEIAKASNDAVAALAAQAMMPKGFAVAIAPPSASTSASSPAGYGPPGGSAAGPPAGVAGPGAGHAGAGGGARPGPPGGRPAGGHAAPAGAGAAGDGPGAGAGALTLGSDGGAAPGGTAGPSAGEAPGGDGSSGGGDPNSFEIVIGASFESEATADAVEKQIKTALQLIQQSGAQFGAGAGAAASAPPGGADGGAINIQAAGGAAGAADGPGAAAAAQAAQRRPPAGAGMRPPGAGAASMRPGNAGGGAGATSADGGLAGVSNPGVGGAEAAMTQMVMNVLASVNVMHEKQNLRISAPLPIPADAEPVPLVGFVLQAAGASALGDGLFEGSLDLISQGMKKWGAGDASAVKSVVRVGQLPVRSGYSWMTQLLPFIGRDDVYSQFDFKKSWDDPKNRIAASQPIPAFLNPADPRTNWTGSRYAGFGLSHFVGVSGVEDTPDVIAATLNRSDPRAGVFGYDRVAKPEEITDGQAQTIMIIGSGGLASPWVMGGGATVRGARSPYIDDLRGFGSRGLPKGGAYAIFADGSARVISSDVDPAIFKAMCTIHGNDKAQ